MTSMLIGQNVDALTEQELDTAVHAGLSRSGAKAETFDRAGAAVSAVALTSGNALYAAINLAAGTVVNSITFMVNSTPAGTPTHALAGLYNSSKAKVASSADLLTAAWAANSEVTVPLASAYTVPADDVYYIAVAITATSTPTLTGVAGHAALNALAPATAFGDTAAVSTALLATATVTAGASQIYAYVK